jgi:hypothetical protein
MEKVSKAVLRYLFQEYLKGPTVLYAINGITDSFKSDVVAVSNFMMEKQWIREQWIHQSNLVTCRITVVGIEEINPAFIHNKLKCLIEGLVKAGGRKSLTEIFQHKIEEYAIALDIVYQLEKLELVTIINEKGTIDVELTTQGWHYAEKQGRSLFTLMAVA